ncbi:hypothetical protein BK133_05805 [Paenibacillus sp. FSL H8-0548]|uniref:stalk domain-containing protein n=1 Tax=Paenibacillus sp. FSL H8-0548 TaxID=1920422 RepID=UPI00096FD16E|nr:stalk domain-containing protein [Paenibacillus sp. FSL H8-0548]OMF37564.1 hypothetical protein BK133_05805 [Paenibacillus sp. FSL H8-0548]
MAACRAVIVAFFLSIFGFSVEIDKSNDIILKKDKTVIKIIHSNNKIHIDGKLTEVKALKVDGSYYIPIRSAVKWANGKIISIDNKSLYISTK